MNFKVLTAFTGLLVSVLIFAQQDTLRLCTVSIMHLNEQKAELTVEVAESRREHTYGLMFRDGLESDKGMLFVYKQDQVLNFWMKNVSFPLDIAYIDSSGVIINIYQMEPNNESRTYRSTIPVRYALEVSRDYFKKHDIKIGDIVQLNGCISK